MYQQFDEEEGSVPLDEDNASEKPDLEVIRQMMRGLLQYRPARFFLLIFGGILVAALIQGGLLGPLILIIVIAAVVFLARGQASIELIERWTQVQVHPFLQKLLIGSPSEVQSNDFVQEQTNVQPFAHLRTLDDLRLLSPSTFEHVVGEVMQHRDYTQVQVVGRSRDLCVDITARSSRGEFVAVQCKRYTTKNVNSDEMQKFIGMIYVHHRADKGLYVTTTSYTKDARKLGEDNNIELIDGPDLIKILRDL